MAKLNPRTSNVKIKRRVDVTDLVPPKNIYLKMLRSARARIDAGWCQGATAKTVTGDVVPPSDPSACSFCLGGALWMSALEFDYLYLYQRVRFIVEKQLQEPHPLEFFNDNPRTTKPLVLALLDATIVKERTSPSWGKAL